MLSLEEIFLQYRFILAISTMLKVAPTLCCIVPTINTLHVMYFFTMQ